MTDIFWNCYLVFFKLFEDPLAVLAAITHPIFKSNWIEDEGKRRDARMQLKQLFSSDSVSPISEKRSTSITENFLNFTQSSEHTKPVVVDFFLRDPETVMKMLNQYPIIKKLFNKYNPAIPSSVLVERLFSQAALVITVRRNRLPEILLEIFLLLKMSFKKH